MTTQKRVVGKPAIKKIDAIQHEGKVGETKELINQLEEVFEITELTDKEADAIDNEIQNAELIKNMVDASTPTDEELLEANIMSAIYNNNLDIQQQITLDEHQRYMKMFMTMHNIHVLNLTSNHLALYKVNLYNYKNDILSR